MTLVASVEIVVTIVVTDWLICVDVKPVDCWLAVDDIPVGDTLNV